MFGSLTATDYIAIRLSYALKNFTYNYDSFCELLREKGFEPFIPRKRTMCEVFETVTARLKGDYKVEDALYKVVMIDASANGSDIIERVILAAAVNRRQQKVTDGDKVARLFYNRTTDDYQFILSDSVLAWDIADTQIDLKPCPGFLKELLENVPAEMAEEAKLASPGQIRGVFNRIVASVGIPVEDIKAAWTIPKDKEHIGRGVKDMAAEINKTLGEKAIRIDLLPIVDDAELKKELVEDAIVFATQEFEALLFREQERIEESPDPEETKKKAMERFEKESVRIMGLIQEHKTALGDALAKIEKAKEGFEENLKIFEVAPSA